MGGTPRQANRGSWRAVKPPFALIFIIAWRDRAGVWRGACSFHLRLLMTATAFERVPLNPELLASLQQRLGDRLSTSASVCAQHGKDESYHAPHAPDAVACGHSPD